MKLSEQEAFVEAYDNTICNIPKEKVAEIVYCYINKLSLSHFPTYELTSVIDALGTWHFACAWQLKQIKEVIT